MKKFLFGSVLLFLTACSAPDHTGEPGVDIAGKLFEAFNRHDWKAMADLYSDSALFLDPAFGNKFVPKSRTETIAKYTEMQAMFPDIHDEVIAMYPAHDAIIIEFISTGTAPDSTTFSLPIACILTLRDGLIVKDATYYDL